MKKKNRSLSRYLSGVLRVLFTPSCWIQVSRYSKSWDKELNDLMETHKFEKFDGFIARIESRKVWVANHPYSSFDIYTVKPLDVRPKRITILRAYDKLLDDLVNFPHDTDAREENKQ